MSYFERPDLQDVRDLRGQFVLTRSPGRVPEGFTRREHGGWELGSCDLPVVGLRSRAGAPLGWCLGHPIVDGVLTSADIMVDTADTARVDWTAVDALYERLAGRFVLVLLTAEEPTVLMDAYGSLAAVFSAQQQIVASTPTLIGADWDDELIRITGFPDRATWLPFGLTLRQGVRRILANHALDLRGWRTERHWLPTPPSAATSGADVAVVVHERIRSAIDAVAAEHPLTLSLTAGRDSRVLLACARDHLDRAALFTLVPDGTDTVDAHLAERLASRFALPHEFLPVLPADPRGSGGWLASTGHAVGGELWRAHESLRRLDPTRVLLPGTAGEVGRAHTFRPGDPAESAVRPETLLRRLRLPAHALYLEHAEAWLAGLPDLPYETTLELGYIEQRLSCWAGPGHYGNQASLFELAPFASRPLFSAMLAAPLAYRHGEQLATDICRIAWPELLKVPFDRFTGPRGTARAVVSRAKRVVKRAVPVLDPARRAVPR
jgi:hypothetical protein